MRFKSLHALGKQKSTKSSENYQQNSHLDSKPLMTDGGDIPYGMDGEENVGGVN